MFSISLTVVSNSYKQTNMVQLWYYKREITIKHKKRKKMKYIKKSIFQQYFCYNLMLGFWFSNTYNNIILHREILYLCCIWSYIYSNKLSVKNSNIYYLKQVLFTRLAYYFEFSLGCIINVIFRCYLISTRRELI